MKLIVAVDENWGIGKDNNLLVHIPEDLKYFKEKTLGKVVVMGRNTFESLPNGPLPQRKNIILTKDINYKADCEICNSIEELFGILKEYDSDDIFIIGGAKVYEEMINFCDTLFITKIFKSFKADRFFRNLDKESNIDINWKSDVKEYNEIRYQFIEYRRK